MSYYPPPGGAQPPYQGHSPVPPSHSPYQQQGYGYQQPPPPHMQNQYPPQGFGQAPYGGPPPPAQGFHSPHPGGYGGPPPPQQGFGGPPPSFPPQHQQSFGQPPYGQQAPYGGHSPQPPFNQGPYGQPPQGGPYGGAPQAPPSPGYVPGQAAPVDMSAAADGVRNAMKGFGTNERALIQILSPLDPLQIGSVKQAFQMRHHRSLVQDLEKETSGWFREGLLAIARGPLETDVNNLNKALKGLGTKEAVLNDVLLGRSNADIHAIKAAYQATYRRALDADVRDDLSMKTERLFTMVLAGRRAEEATPVTPQQTDSDVQEIYRCTEGQKMGTDQIAICSILASRSDGQIRAVAQAYQQRYHRPLSDVLRKSFSGHMEDALLFMLSKAEDQAKHDAHLLEDAMKGMGTKDDLLVNRIVRIHWDRQRMGQCRAAYRHFFKRELVQRIQSETRGDYERLMVASVEI